MSEILRGVQAYREKVAVAGSTVVLGGIASSILRELYPAKRIPVELLDDVGRWVRVRPPHAKPRYLPLSVESREQSRLSPSYRDIQGAFRDLSMARGQVPANDLHEVINFIRSRTPERPKVVRVFQAMNPYKF